MYDMLYSCNKVSWSKENVEEAIRERTYLYGTGLWNMEHVSRHNTVQTHIVKGQLCIRITQEAWKKKNPDFQAASPTLSQTPGGGTQASIACKAPQVTPMGPMTSHLGYDTYVRTLDYKF